ncbi:hypothetical protein M0811_08653 [Anaeramoeba ignava]|uniref:Fibronectin type-III domain-containing protein n=1 Tax=Anaeramoeba ignava TaxID=1746090 RepID=A0A9Q0LHN0_ANAIG|nr:hypothetical protein M0811_08653 [Anaeramoeba ignava]
MKIYNGSIWNQEQVLDKPLISSFGKSVSIYEDVIVIGADYTNQVFIYRYNGTIWNQEQNFYEPLIPYFGWSVSIYENVTVIGTYGANQAFIYRYNGTNWNQEENLSEPSYSYFGSSVSIYKDVIVIGAPDARKAYIYRYNESIWNQEQNLSEPLITNFGWSVSIYEDVIVIGAPDAKKAYIYRYNEPIWNQEKFLSESITNFGYSVSIYGNFTVIGAPDVNKVFVYEGSFIPQVNIVNCSSLFSLFDCYWDKIQSSLTLIYQINYGYDWIDIDSPILEDGNVYYQQFNSSIYDNITGNEYYSIQIKACDISTMKCGESSSFINLTTKIDSVKNFQLSNPSNNSINVTWDYPNVQINEGIAHLNHYNLSYFIQSQPDLISFISVDNSSLDYFLNNLECENDYNISICGCRTHECEGDNKGEIVESSISLLFGEITNLTCSISNSIDINCNWNQPINCSIPFYYNLTYQSIYQNDSGNYQPTSSNQQFTVQIPNQEYQINISACNSNGKCGYISSISIKTDNLTSPIIYETISKIEEIEFNFTKLTNAKNYSISLDNETNWGKFTSLDLSGNEVIGIISGISGNIEYNISIRGCVDLNCETPYLGLPSSIISTRAKLGNITSLNCNSLINGFECSWNSLILSSGLKAYSFTYNSTSICLSNLTTIYSVSGLNEGEYYEISIYSSADLNCSFNEYSGINSTTSITISTINESNNNSKTTAITLAKQNKTKQKMKLILFFSFSFFLIINIFLIKSNQNQNQNQQNSISTIIQELETTRLLTETTRYYSTPDEAWIWNLLDQFSGSGYFGHSVSIYGDVTVIGTGNANQSYIYRYNGSIWNQEQILSEPSASYFGSSVSIYEDVIVIGAPGANQSYIYRYNGTIWNQEQILSEPSASYFGSPVSIYEDVIVIGAPDARKAFIYRYNGTNWNQEENLSEPSYSNFGFSVSIYEDVIVIGTYGANQVFIYRYNGSIWNEEQVLDEPLISNFGFSVSVYEDVIVIGTYGANQAFIYRYNESIWNEEQILSEPSYSYFGWSVSIYEDVIVIGAPNANKAFIYRYNESIWNQEKFLSESATDFGNSVSIYENFTVIGAYVANQAFVYEGSFIPQVNILNCSSLFSSFDCYWDKIEFPSTLKYQINYGYDWIDIDYPILEDGNVYYQQFNSSIYDNITGNEYYSIQIKACDISTMKCGESSSFINLTTKIDSVKDFQLSNPSNNSINVTWNYPNVQINEGIAHLNHYNLSYIIQSQPDLISFISVDNSSLDYLLNNLECENDYNISICGCRTQECEGDDKGEIVESSISLLFGEVTNLTCSISNSIDINCNWNQPINCSIPFYYNLTYQSIYQNDSGNYQPTSSNQQFTVQIPNQEYQINISACNSNGKCGYISSISIKTDNLTSPIIYETISKIEEIEFNFTKLINANNYSISLDNGTNWEKFTSLDLSGNEIIGIISGISGNIEYNISIRGCVDLNCETPYLGLPSSIISTRAKLGNITSLNCYSLINGFECNWNSLILSSGLKAYSFTYNSTSICLSNLTTIYSVSGLNEGEYYEISIYSSADLNCSFNQYSGINSTTSITISTINESNNNSNTAAITLGIIIPIIVISIIIIGIIFYKKKRRKQIIKEIIKENKEEQELQDNLDI